MAGNVTASNPLGYVGVLASEPPKTSEIDKKLAKDTSV